MKSLFVPLELTTKTRNLTFESELDPNIDIVRVVEFEIMISLLNLKLVGEASLVQGHGCTT